MNKLSKIEEIQRQRLEFLHEVYDICDASTIEMIDGRAIGEKLGFNEEQFIRTIYYLHEEHLLELGTSNQVGLTHLGINEVEAALLKPEESTDYFPATVNTVYVENMINSQIQQGTENSEQNITINQESKSEINQILDEISARLNEIEDNGISEDIKADIDTIISQLKALLSKIIFNSRMVL